MASNRGHGTEKERHQDVRALRFALIFPALLAVALVVGGLVFGLHRVSGMVLPWGGNPVSLPGFLVVGAACIVVLGGGIGSQGARTTLPRTLRRVLLGMAMALQLAIFTLFMAALLGQAGGAPAVRIDGYVVLMGCGLAAAMGVVLALTFKPDEQWSSSDDVALARALEDAQDPGAADDRLRYFIHPRSSVIMMIVLAAVLPGALLVLISPWILVGIVALALLIVAMLCATVQLDRGQLTVKLFGAAPVIIAPCESVAAAVSLDIVAKDYGGWGLRKHHGSATFLSYSGAAVVLRNNDGGRVVVSAPNLDVADALSAILNRRAGKTPQDR
ncbi:hypothetical protein [Arthrobacter sp. GMC3]|uniref:hypothetical protein n=1 Tax=Arthrobacter sp. GMC3 TaxID=2058894 RepID=UPI000CE3C5FC|nr:hypothetical protein [Arthrobacter sp. GMC3]